MPSTYTLPVQATEDLLAHVREKYHPRLNDEDVKIGVVMAFAGVHPDTGERTGHAIKGHAGAAAAAQVKSVPLKDRVTKRYDVELLIDGDHWPELSEREKIAILDHELTHIETTGKVDDLHRPKVKMREEDFIAWGFWEVIQRHGPAAMEHRALKTLADKHGQLLLTLGDDIPPEPVRRGSGIESMTITSGDSSVTINREDAKRILESCDAQLNRLSATGQQINEHLKKKRGSKAA